VASWGWPRPGLGRLRAADAGGRGGSRCLTPCPGQGSGWWFGNRFLGPASHPSPPPEVEGVNAVEWPGSLDGHAGGVNGYRPTQAGVILTRFEPVPSI
jgi:hypothetical protein